MERILEPELMEDERQSIAYAKADFSTSNQLFVDGLNRDFPQRLRIVDRHLDVERAVVGPAKTLGHPRLIRERASVEICPQPVAQSDRLHDQRVSLPSSGRVAIPGGLRILRQRSPVGVDLAELHVALVQDHDKTA